MKAAFIVFAVLVVAAWSADDLPFVCKGDQPSNVTEFHPHPCACDTYYVCMGTEPVPMPCPKGLHWDRVLNKCNWPGDAKCKPEPTCPQKKIFETSTN